MKCQRNLIIISILLALAVQGCASVGIIRMERIPTLRGGSPLSGIEPVTCVIKDFRDEVGEVVFSEMGGIVKIDRGTADIVVQAIAAELRRNGHKVMEPKDVDMADVVIDGTVKQFWIELRQHFLYARILASVKVEITVTSASGGKTLSKLYSGISAERGMGNRWTWEERYRDSLNEALSNMVKDFTTDPDFLDGLRKGGVFSNVEGKDRCHLRYYGHFVWLRPHGIYLWKSQICLIGSRFESPAG